MIYQCFGNFSVILQPWNFCKAEFTYVCSAREATRKMTKILRSFGFYLEF